MNDRELGVSPQQILFLANALQKEFDAAKGIDPLIDFGKKDMITTLRNWAKNPDDLRVAVRPGRLSE